MSARVTLLTAVMAELGGNEMLEPLSVFDAPPTRALFPYAVVEDPVLEARNAAGVEGRVGTLAITYRDEGERPLRLRGAIALTEELIDLMPTALGDGWRLAGLALARSRLARVKDGWLARSEWAVRVFRSN